MLPALPATGFLYICTANYLIWPKGTVALVVDRLISRTGDNSVWILFVDDHDFEIQLFRDTNGSRWFDFWAEVT